MISSEPEDLPEDQVLPGEDISPDWAQVNALQARKRADDAAKIADLEERNANQVQKIGTLKSSLAQMTRAHDEMIEKYNAVTEQKDRLVNQFWRRPFKDLTPEEKEAAGRLADAVRDFEPEDTPVRTEYVRIDHMPEVHPLVEWWMRTAREEVEPLIAKMTEYGGGGRAVDLTQIGEALLIAGLGEGKTHRGQPTEGDIQELGVYFYLVGKFARWTAAIAEGRSVSDDTLHDIGIYVRMAQRIRQSGGWPT